MPSPCCDSGESYPTLCLRDNQVKAFLDGNRIEPGKEYTATIQFKMEGWRDSDYGKTLDLKVLSAGDVAQAEEDTEDPEDASDPSEEVDPVVKVAYRA